MIDFVKKLFEEKPDLQFVDSTRTVYPHYPPILAKDIKPFFKEFQEKDNGTYNFPGCPGMHDYSRLGYIIPAWCDIHIKANKAGTVIKLGTKEANSKRGTPYPNAVEITRPIVDAFPMSTDVTDGLFQFEDGIKPTAWNVPGPWKIYGQRNVSALLLPAVFHSPFLEDLYVYPGVVDYREFTVANFIMSPRRKCEITIKAGTPLLHVIPFITTKDITATYGPGTNEQIDAVKASKHMFESNWYRRWYMIKKRFFLKKQTD